MLSDQNECVALITQGLRSALPADPDDHEAALLGAVPLMLGTGTGSEIRQPLGYAIVGGLIVSQALTLYTTPIVFLYLDRFNAWFTSASRPKSAGIAGRSSHRQIPPAVAGSVGD